MKNQFQKAVLHSHATRPVATVNDSDCTLSGLPSGKTVRVQIVSANDAGQAQPSDIAEIIVA